MTASTVIRLAMRNIVWMFAHSWGSAIFGLVSFAIMARILGPEPYGIMALAALVFGVVGIFVGAPLTESLQQREEITDAQLDTTFWLNSGLTIVFAVAITLLAGPLALIVGAPAVAEVLPAISLIMVFGSVEAVPGALLQRRLENEKLVWIDTAAEVLSTAVALVLALMGFGVWALVASMAVASLISAAGTVYAAKWRPGFAVTADAFRELFAFNRDTVVTYLLGYFDDAIPRVLLSHVAGERAVGLLSMAGTVAGTLTDLMMGPFNDIAMNVVARLQSSRKMVHDLLDRVFAMTTAAIYPATLGLAVVAPLLIPLLVGNEWVAAVLPLQIFLILGIRDATGTFNIAILRGVGDSRSPLLILTIGILLLVVMAPFLLPYGVSGIAALVTLRTFLTWPLSAALVQRAAGYPALHQLTVGWQALLSAFGMTGAVILVQKLLPAGLPDVVTIACMVGTGILSYAGLMLLIGARQVREIRDGMSWFRNHHDGVADAA
jgi:polysaccharide transporter, PST family